MHGIGNRIKLLREEKKMNQKQFAEKIMVSQSYLSRVERGIEIPTNKLIKLIALEFDIPTDWLQDKSNISDVTDKISSDNYDRAYSNELTEHAVCSINNLAKRINILNNAAISQLIPGVIDELSPILNNDPVNILISESILEITYTLCEQLKKYSKSTTHSEFLMIKAECLEALLSELNSLGDLIDNNCLK